MATRIPVRGMRDTAAFASLVEREGDVAATKDGYGVMHCMSEGKCRLQREEVARAGLLSRMMLAESELSAGESRDFDSFAAGVRRRHGL